MKTVRLKLGLALVAMVFSLSTATAVRAELIEQFSVGTRWKTFQLTGDKNFTGTITASTVDEQTEWYPTNFNMQFWLCKYGGLTLEYDRFRAVMQQDGQLKWDTFTLGLTGRLPLEKWRLAPYVVAGVTYNMPQFSEDDWWRYGWNSPGEFNRAAASQPAGADTSWMRTGRIRNMQTDSAFGFVYALGLDFFVTKNIAINADVRWNKASTDVTYTISDDSSNADLMIRHFSYDLDTVSYALGVHFYF